MNSIGDCRIALGAWAWGDDSIFANGLKEPDLAPVFGRAFDCGLRLWDTAPVYGGGSSERMLGSFIKKVPRSSIAVSTKFPPQLDDGSDDFMERMLEGSLSRLGVDYIDIYWIHHPRDVEKWTRKIIPLAERGVIKAIGVSNHNLDEIRRADEILSSSGLHVAAVQNHYSLLHRSSERAGIIDYCNENGIAFFSYMVLEQGALTGKYDSEHPFAEGTRRASVYNPMLGRIGAVIGTMREIGTAYGVSPSQIAIAWAIAKGTHPIIGVTKQHQVEEAHEAASIVLDGSEIKAIEDAAGMIDVNTLRAWEKEM